MQASRSRAFPVTWYEVTPSVLDGRVRSTPAKSNLRNRFVVQSENPDTAKSEAKAIVRKQLQPKEIIISTSFTPDGGILVYSAEETHATNYRVRV